MSITPSFFARGLVAEGERLLSSLRVDVGSQQVISGVIFGEDTRDAGIHYNFQQAHVL
jgi:hypothetical protein